MLALTGASLKATFRSPQSVFFSLFFPIVLIWIFGSLGSGNGIPSVSVAFENGADTTNPVYSAIRMNPVFKLIDTVEKNKEEELLRGRIAGIINISANSSVTTPYKISIRSSQASARDLMTLNAALSNTIRVLDSSAYPQRQTTASIDQRIQPGGRRYRMIDFFLPGMIGFALIGAAVFGVAFSFYSLRETLVLKRMYSTPIKKLYIILGESLAKVIFQLVTVVVLIAFGYFVYDFTLANGLVTFLNMLILSFLALLVFMGFGFLITGVAKNQNVIPIYANLFMFPQYFLSGTFFAKSALPQFLQPIIKFLPLTALNDAMRNVAFEGAPLSSCTEQILILAAWGVLIYLITARVFKWE